MRRIRKRVVRAYRIKGMQKSGGIILPKKLKPFYSPEMHFQPDPDDVEKFSKFNQLENVEVVSYLKKKEG